MLRVSKSAAEYCVSILAHPEGVKMVLCSDADTEPEGSPYKP